MLNRQSPITTIAYLQLHRMKESTQDSKLCKKKLLPPYGKCLTKCVLYTEITSNNQETYIGLTENEFKTRFNLPKSSFKLEHKRTSTTLSDHVLKLKKKNINFNIKWQVVKRRGGWGHPLLDNNNLLYRHHRRDCTVKQRAIHTHTHAHTHVHVLT